MALLEGPFVFPAGKDSPLGLDFFVHDAVGFISPFYSVNGRYCSALNRFQNKKLFKRVGAPADWLIKSDRLIAWCSDVTLQNLSDRDLRKEHHCKRENLSSIICPRTPADRSHLSEGGRVESPLLISSVVSHLLCWRLR